MSDDNNRPIERRSVLQSIGAFGALAGLSGVSSATPSREPGPKESEVIVGVDSSVSNVRAAVEPKIPSNAEIVHTNETLGYAAVELSDGASVQAKENVKRTLQNVNEVQYTEDNATYHIVEAEPLGSADSSDEASPQLRPSDPRFREQYAPQQVNCPEAWEETLGDPSVTIAIVDQGMQYDHPQLEPNMDESVSNGGQDFVDDDADPYPAGASENHGTHVGGIAGGAVNNGSGHAGISNCSLLSARALGSRGGGSLSDIADAVQWAADQGADIINMSLGGGGATDLMQQACQYAHDQGSLLVAAAGNGSGAPVSYPAAYDTVLAVSAVDENESLARYSNVGPEIELAAPGTNVLSSVPFGNYEEFSGTSMASPVVAGVAGLTLSQWPNLTNEQLRTHLKETAVNIGLDETEQGSGRVDAGNAVTTDPGTDPDPDPGPDPDPDPGPGECGAETNTASADGSLSGGWWGNPSDTYTYELETSNPCGSTVTLEGAANTDFDLYVTLDGRTPTTYDYDERSITNDSNESIEIELDGSETLGILVTRYSGSGSYTVSVEERGR